MSSQKVSGEPAVAEPAEQAPTRRSPATAVLQRLGEGLFGLLFAALLVLILASIVGRNIGHGLPWWVDAAQLLFVYLALTGGVVSYATGDAIAFTEVVRRLPQAVSEAAGGVTVGAVLGLSVIECYASTQAMLAVQGQVSTIAGIPSVLYAAPFAVAFLLWALIGLVRTARMVRHPLSVVGVLVGIAIVALPYLVSSSDGPSTTQALGFAFVIMLVLLLVGTPLAFVLLSGAYLTNALAAFSSQQLPIDLVSATGDILLLAIPFFIFVGYLLTDGSLSRRSPGSSTPWWATCPAARILLPSSACSSSPESPAPRSQTSRRCRSPCAESWTRNSTTRRTTRSSRPLWWRPSGSSQGTVVSPKAYALATAPVCCAEPPWLARRSRRVWFCSFSAR